MTEDPSRNESSPPLDMEELQSFLKISLSETKIPSNKQTNEHPNDQSNSQAANQSDDQPIKRSRSINEAEDVQAYLSITKTLKRSMPPPPNRPPKKRPNLLGSSTVKQEESRSTQQQSDTDNVRSVEQSIEQSNQSQSSDETLSSDDDDGNQSPEHKPTRQSPTNQSNDDTINQPIKRSASALDEELIHRSINQSINQSIHPAEAADGGGSCPSDYVKRFYDEDTAAERRCAIDQAYHRRLQQVDQLIMCPLTEAAQQHLNNQDEDQKLLQERDAELDATLSEFIAYLHKVRMSMKPQSKQRISSNA